MRWTCPRCDREFARIRQSHVCVSGCTVDETFADRPAGQRAAYDAAVEHLRREGPVHEDAVRIGVFLKSEGKIAELRPTPRGFTLLFLAGEVDDVVRGLLTEAYAAADG